jgi:hypothetical protein
MSLLGGSLVTKATRPQVADGVVRIRRVAANILNKQSRTADKGWPSRFGGVFWAKNPSTQIFFVTKYFKTPMKWTYSSARTKQWKKRDIWYMEC